MQGEIILELFFAIKTVGGGLTGNEKIYKLLSAMPMMPNKWILFHINLLINLINSLRHNDRIYDHNDPMIRLSNKTALIVPHGLIRRLKRSGLNFNFNQRRKLQFRA